MGPGAVYGERAVTVDAAVVGDRRMALVVRGGCRGIPAMRGASARLLGLFGLRSGRWPWPGEEPLDRRPMGFRGWICRGDGRSVMPPAPMAAPVIVAAVIVVADRDRTSR